MKRMDRRSFMLVAAAGGTGAFLVACGNDPDDVDLNPTMIPVEGAPPTLAPMATPGGGATAGGEETGEETGGGDTGVVTLEAQDPFAWSTTELEAAPGQTIQVTNVGALEHDFVIDELSIKEVLNAGEPVNVVLPADLAVGDTYTYYCSIPGHRESGMEGTLTIVEASAEAPAEEGGDEGEGEGAAPAGGDGGPVILEAQDPFAWSTKELEAAPGATIQVTNTGVLEHDFVIDELSIKEVLNAGEPVDVVLPADLAVGDTYTYYCSIPGHREQGMEGTLTIVDAAAAAPADDAAAPADGGDESTPEAAAEEGSPAAEDEEFAVPQEAIDQMSDPAVVPLEATDPYNWSKKELSAAPGQVVRVLNRGVLEHDFVIDEFDISQVLEFGVPIDIALPGDAEVGSTHEYYCSIPGHRERGMVGVLTIVEGDGSAVATPAATSEASPVAEAPAGGGATTVELSTVDIAFEPSEFTIPANTDVTINITNKGALEHDFAVDDLEIASDLISGGETTTITINAAPGTYEFHCTVTGHKEAGMVGTLTVE